MLGQPFTEDKEKQIYSGPLLEEARMEENLVVLSHPEIVAHDSTTLLQLNISVVTKYHTGHEKLLAFFLFHRQVSICCSSLRPLQEAVLD